MAKAKDKKSSGKSNKSTGKKLAKSVKKSGFMDLLNFNLGREILADALIAAAGAAAAALTRTRPAKQAGAAVADASSQVADTTKDTVQTAAGAVAGVVTARRSPAAARLRLSVSVVGCVAPRVASAIATARSWSGLARSGSPSSR